MTGIRDTVAMRIRECDPDGILIASDLGESLGIVLAPQFTDVRPTDVQRFVVEFSWAGDWTAADLADAIVDHFYLDKES